MATNEELEKLVPTLNLNDIPAKLKCSCCSQFVGLSVFRLPCCDQSVCQPCKETIKESCPVCDHSPLDPADINGSKAQRLTAKAFLKGELRKREEADQRARKAQQAAEAKVSPSATTTADMDAATPLLPLPVAAEEAVAGEAVDPPNPDSVVQPDGALDNEAVQTIETTIPPRSPGKHLGSHPQTPSEQNPTEEQSQDAHQQQQMPDFGNQMLNPNMAYGGMPNMNWVGGSMFNPMMGAFGMSYPNMMNPNMGMDPSMMMANGMFGGMGGPGMNMNDMNAMAMNETNGGWNEELAVNGMNGGFEDYSSGFFQGNGFNQHGMSNRGRFVQRPYRNYYRGRGRGGYFSPFQGPRGGAHSSPGVAGAPTGPRAATYSHPQHFHQQTSAAEGSESMHSDRNAIDGTGDMQVDSQAQVVINGTPSDHVDDELNAVADQSTMDVDTGIEQPQDAGKHVHVSEQPPPTPPPTAPTGPAAMLGSVRPVEPARRGVVGAPTGPKAMRDGAPNTGFRGRGGFGIVGRGSHTVHTGPSRSMSIDKQDEQLPSGINAPQDENLDKRRHTESTSKSFEDDARGEDEGHRSSRRSSKYDRDYHDRDRESSHDRRHRRRRRRDEESHSGYSGDEGERKSNRGHRHDRDHGRDRDRDRNKDRSKYRERDEYDGDDSHRRKHKSSSSRRERDRSLSPDHEHRHSSRRDRDRDRDRNLPASVPTGPASKTGSRHGTAQEFKIKDRSKAATTAPTTLDALRDRVRDEKPDIDDYALDREARNRERLLREQQRRTGYGLDGASDRHGARKRGSRAAGLDEDKDADVDHQDGARRRRGSRPSRRVSYAGEDEDEMRARRVESEREAARWG